MAKRYWSGDQSPSWTKRQACIRCGRTIVYGDRCEEHKRELRLRQKRKPR